MIIFSLKVMCVEDIQAGDPMSALIKPDLPALPILALTI